LRSSKQIKIKIKIEIKITSICLTAGCFAFGELLDKAPPSVSKSSQGLVLLVWPDFVGFPHSDDAPWARAERTSLS
jgi:hypothetical protein